MRIQKWQLRRLLPLLVCAAGTVFAQLYTGNIAGTVKDSSGAVVPNAKVTITDQAKGFNYTANTDNSGQFTVKNLPPANYTEKVAAPGFTPFEQPNMVLEVNGSANGNAILQVATAGQTVTVSETGGTQLQTENAVTGQTINQRLINNLPLISRNVYDLAYLTPGVSQPPGQAYGSAGGGIGNNFTSDGERNSQADILVDGITTTTYEQNTGFVTPLYTPSPEAVQEFSIEQSNFSAQIGFASGTVVNLVTKSGSNQIHGELYDFLRNTDLDANSFFNNLNGVPTSAYHQNNFGGTIGGPVIKNRVFFFFDYDGNRQITPAQGTYGVPSALERTGNFGELCGNHGGAFSAAGLCSVAAGQIWDPYSAVQNQTYGPGGQRQNFIPFNNMTTYASPGNPAAPYITPNVRGNLINPIAQKVASFFPLPNTGGTPGTASYNAFNNFYGTASNASNNNQYDIKLDSRLTDVDQLSIRFSQQWGNEELGNIFGNALDAYTQGPNTSLTYSGAVNYTHTFNPTTLLTATAGYDHNWAHTNGNAVNFPSTTIQSLGFSPTVASQLMQSGFNGLPAFQISNYSAENGNANIGGQPYSGLLYGRDVYHFIGSVAKTIGNHDLHFGAEFRAHRINFTQFGEPNGLFGFTQGGTSNFQNVGGDSMATFLTGFANNWSAYEIPATPATENFQYGGFIQDNWHVNDRLTLNLGVRYDIDAPRTERYNGLSFFDPNAPSPLKNVPGVPATGSFEYVNANGYGRSPYQTYYGAVGPRIGFAYRLGTDWVMRGGYGIYYDPSKYGAAGTGSGGAGFQGFDQQTSFQNYNNSSNWIPNLVLGQPLSISKPPGKSQGVYTQLGNSLTGIPIYNYNTLPQEQSWSFGIQRQLPWKVLVDAEYVGRKGTHLYLGGDTSELNHLSEATANAFRANPSAFNGNVPTPPVLTNAIKAVTPPYSNGFWGGTWPAYNAFLPYPQYPIGPYGSAGLSNVDPPIGNSIYHSFQLSVNKRFSSGLQFLFSYTLQKSIDDSSIAGSSVYIDGYSGATLASIQDPNNLRAERSLSEFDIPQVVQFTGVYALPFGRGKMFGSHWNKVVDGVLGGWQVNGIYRWDDGLPLLLFLQNGVNIPTFGGQRPNLPYALQTSGQANPNVNYFSNAPVTPAAIALFTPAPYVEGNAPRTLSNVRQSGTNNVSASLFKDFSITERFRLELRGEAFNLLNRVQFGAPNTTIGQQNFGIITSQANSPREMQVALKLYF